MDKVLIAFLCALLGGFLVALCMTVFQNRALRKERLKCRQQVEELEFEKQLLMRSQETVLLVLNEFGIVKLANNHAYRFFKKEQVEGKHFRETVGVSEILLAIEQSIHKNEQVKQELQIISDSDEYQLGEERSLFLNIKPIAGDKGLYTRIYITDNTEQYRAEQIRKDFVANASHELRTPLAIINGYIETLMDEEVLDDKETSLHFLGIMKKHGHRITRMIEEMLLISKLESGLKNSLKRSIFPVINCIDECLAQLDPIIKEKGVRVNVKMNEPGLSIQADRFYWDQILFNLIENAIKQNPDHQLKIKIGCTQSKNSGKVKIWVSDNGVGIPAADLPFIFRRFYRVEKHHSQTKIKGTGLGLSIVKRAVEAHDGEIQCDSVQNQLTRFTITLPSSIRVVEEAV